MHTQARYALAHPVFNPETEITAGHYWRIAGTRLSACFTVNIGME